MGRVVFATLLCLMFYSVDLQEVIRNMSFNARVVLNGVEFLCSMKSVFFNMKLMPLQDNTHSLCMHHDLLILSRIFSRHCVRHDIFC